jgi:hypothetical protein
MGLCVDEGVVLLQSAGAHLFCVHICAAWTFGRSPLLIALTMTLEMPPSSRLLVLSEVEM